MNENNLEKIVVFNNSKNFLLNDKEFNYLSNGT